MHFDAFSISFGVNRDFFLSFPYKILATVAIAPNEIVTTTTTTITMVCTKRSHHTHIHHLCVIDAFPRSELTESIAVTLSHPHAYNTLYAIERHHVHPFSGTQKKLIAVNENEAK